MRMDLKFGGGWFDSQNPPTAPRHGCGGNTFQTQTFPSDMATWSTALHQWESELREYERRFKTPFSEDEKVSILAHGHQKNCNKAYSCTAMR